MPLEYCIPQTISSIGSQCNTQTSNSRFVSLRVSKFRSDSFSARATSQEVMFTSLTEKLTYCNSIYNHYENQDSRKVYTTTGLQQVGSGASSLHQGSPRLCAPGWPVLMSCKGILKDASNDMSCQSLLQQSTTQYLNYLKYNILPPIAKAKVKHSAECRLGDDNLITNGINLRKSPRAGLRAE